MPATAVCTGKVVVAQQANRDSSGEKWTHYSIHLKSNLSTICLVDGKCIWNKERARATDLLAGSALPERNFNRTRGS